MEKLLQAKLRENPTVAVRVDADFGEDWLRASTMVEQYKRNLLHELKKSLHEKVAVLSLDDIEFKITDNSVPF